VVAKSREQRLRGINGEEGWYSIAGVDHFYTH
jgi:hypothetical protein